MPDNDNLTDEQELIERLVSVIENLLLDAVQDPQTDAGLKAVEEAELIVRDIKELE